jgi:hypothetical protein
MIFLKRILAWPLGTKQRFIWTYGVVLFGGGLMIVLPPSSGPIVLGLFEVAIKFVAGYVGGWLVWWALNQLMPMLLAPYRSN